MPDTLPSRADVSWSPRVKTPPAGWNRPGMGVAVARGAAGRCPCCGKARLFRGWLKPVAVCPHCAAPLGRVRADDVPPYVVVFIVAHLIIGTQFALDDRMGLSLTAEAAIFLPLTLALCLGLLRPVKGAIIGAMLQLGLVAAADA